MKKDYPIPSPNELKAMSEIDIRTVTPDSLEDISEVEIDTTQPRAERVKQFIRQVGNPYLYKDHGIVVKVSFDNGSGKTLTECLCSMLESYR